MKYVKPDYDHSIVSVVNSIEKYFGILESHKSLSSLDEYFLKTNCKNVVLILFDGLGFNLLKRNQNSCPFLNKYLKEGISTVFPSTTMAARTSIESGLYPIEHGWMGWDMYFKDFDEVITLTKNVIRGTNNKAARYHVAKTLLNYESIVDKINKLDNCFAKKLTIYSNHKHESFNKLSRKIKRITKKKERTYTYVYCNEPDHVLHKTGSFSLDTKKWLKKIDRWFSKLCSKLNHTVIIVLADHGHINNKYITLEDYPEIMKMLKSDIAIDNRACSFRVKEEYKNQFSKDIQKILKDDFLFLTKEDILKEKYYGDALENKYFQDGLGDFFAIGISDVSIRQNSKNSSYISSHSGLTEEEMLVPLILYSKNK